MFKHKENSGSLFKNTNKKTDNHPDYTGIIDIGGKVMRIAGWKKAGKEGTTFLSLQVSEEKQEEQKTNKKASPFDGMDDSIPF